MTDCAPNSHHSVCSSCADLLERHFDRRRFLVTASAGLMAATFAPWQAFASDHYEAMVLSCIDPRLQEPVSRYTAKRGLTGKFSHFVVAGAAVGVVAAAFKDWHETFWGNLDASIGLHGIKKLIVINHRQCGAARIAYGDDAIDPGGKVETETHRWALRELRQQLSQRHPDLVLEAFLMDLEGNVESL